MAETQKRAEIPSIPTGEWLHPFEKTSLEQLETPGENSLVFSIEGANIFMKVILEDTPPNVVYIQNRNVRRKGLIVEMPAQGDRKERHVCYLKDAVGDIYKGRPETIDDKIIVREWVRELPDPQRKAKPEQFIKTAGYFKRIALSIK